MVQYRWSSALMSTLTLMGADGLGIESTGFERTDKAVGFTVL